MIGLFLFVLAVLASPFKSKVGLEAENAVLRHQLNVLRRRLHGRVRITNHDRWFFHSHEHVRAGTSSRTGWVRNGHSPVSGLVHLPFGGYDQCGPHVEEHWPRSASA